MYGLKSGVDLSFFLGKTLIQVCFGAHDLILHFTGNVSVTVTSAVGVQKPAGEFCRYDDFRRAASSVLELLEQEVTGVVGSKDSTLLLTFVNGLEFRVYDDSRMYESYVIKHGAKEIIV